MCDVADARCPVWNVSHPRARKAHECMACSEPIEVGHVYRLTKSLWEGSWSDWKHCQRCAAMLDALEDRALDQLIEIDPHLNCGESWEDVWGTPPLEVAALAFALPKDFQVTP